MLLQRVFDIWDHTQIGILLLGLNNFVWILERISFHLHKNADKEGLYLYHHKQIGLQFEICIQKLDLKAMV